MTSSQFQPVNHRTKSQAVCAQITEFAVQLGADAKLPTVLELCRMTGVSVTTLNSALSELESQNVIYRKHGVGIFVSPQLSQKCVGLVCDPAFFQPGTSPFWQQLIEGAHIKASSSGETVRFYFTLPSTEANVPAPQDLVEDIRARRLQGILLVGNKKPIVQWLGEQGVPVVTFAGWGEWTVQIDSNAIIGPAVDRLVEQNCQRIALLVPSDGVEPHRQQSIYQTAFHALRTKLKSQSLAFLPEWVWDAQELDGKSPRVTNQEQGYHAILDLFGENARLDSRPDGLIIYDDMMARGALVAMKKLGLQPGKKLKIVSHINRGSSVLHGFEAEMSLVEVDPAEVVQGLFTLLEELMEGRTPTETTVWVGASLKS